MPKKSKRKSLASLLTSERAKTCNEALKELFDGLPKTRQQVYFPHLNEISLFLEDAIRELPKGKKEKKIAS